MRLPRLSDQEIARICCQDLSVAFTASREGLTRVQYDIVSNIVATGPDQVMHGDCIGGDASIHEICVQAGLTEDQIVIYPGMSERFRAFKTEGKVHPPRDNHQRNRLMVMLCERLIACPNTMKKSRRSGTWYTISYALSRAVPTYIIFPDGKVAEKK